MKKPPPQGNEGAVFLNLTDSLRVSFKNSIRFDRLNPMYRLDPFCIEYLVAAAETTGDDLCARGSVADRRQQPPFRDFHRQVIMLFLIPERSGHAAAAGIQLVYFRSLHPPQQ